MIKIHVFDKDIRRLSDPLYEQTAGSFGVCSLGFNKALKKLGHYADPDDADVICTVDGLDLAFKYKNKRMAIVSVWETINSLTQYHLQQYNQHKPILFGLSDQITNLWLKYGIPCKTVLGGCDTDFWKPIGPKNEIFTFLHVNFSNIRSGFDIAIAAFAEAFKGNKHVQLIIKNTTDNPLIEKWIDDLKKQGCNIQYINKRVTIEEVRELYSQSHVCLNPIRCTSFGLPLLESSACDTLCITGNTPPTNDLIRPNYGVLIPPSNYVEIYTVGKILHEKYGLTDCYPKDDWTKHFEQPLMYNFEYRGLASRMDEIRYNWGYYGKIKPRQEIVKNWGWERGAQQLIDYLS